MRPPASAETIVCVASTLPYASGFGADAHAAASDEPRTRNAAPRTPNLERSMSLHLDAARRQAPRARLGELDLMSDAVVSRLQQLRVAIEVVRRGNDAFVESRPGGPIDQFAELDDAVVARERVMQAIDRRQIAFDGFAEPPRERGLFGIHDLLLERQGVALPAGRSPRPRFPLELDAADAVGLELIGNEVQAGAAVSHARKRRQPRHVRSEERRGG